MRSYTWKHLVLLVLAGAAVLGEAVYIVSLKVRTHPEDMAARLPEQIVFGRASDDIIEAGSMFTPVNDHAKPIAIIWIHGWGVNFYQPTYVGIGRELAARGYTVISANTRMHDLGNVEAWRWMMIWFLFLNMLSFVSALGAVALAARGLSPRNHLYRGYSLTALILGIAEIVLAVGFGSFTFCCGLVCGLKG